MTDLSSSGSRGLRALSPQDRAAHVAASVGLLVRQGAELAELDDGFELRFSAEPGRLVELARWVERESLCCLWMEFTILRSPDDLLRLRLSAPAYDVKEAIRAGLQAVTAISRGAPLPVALTLPARPLLAADLEELQGASCGSTRGSGWEAAA
ncbi:hypothetical protein OOT46_16195 [Aquabacterium sp. A7-Y]|uniref:hypothetical protein n=1 Tax=Aquabacterium sp. A7-Y TaxID=1349605 RepID=UPI00223E8A2D|nr:hypothetical protein [Aquabacterium sp. A7-Y]MCW7539386.1 hypothetical protein [Aquabacterium sp. A7-Y]